MTADIFAQLAAQFPRESVSWRAQTVIKGNDGYRALALAYIDARDVMERLDSVVGPANWQDSYATHGDGKTVCTLALRIDGEWISKSDGSGASDIEAEKGSLSGAFKRAAVKWGIGRYLYDIASPWVPCEAYERNNKAGWKSWKADPWTFVRGGPAAQKAAAKPAPAKPATGPVKVSAPSDREWYAAMRTRMHQCETLTDLNTVWQVNADGVVALPDAGQKSLTDEYQRLASALSQAPIEGRAQ